MEDKLSAVLSEFARTMNTDFPIQRSLAAYATDGPICIPDLAEDDRFPRFAAQAREEVLVAVFTFPLRDGDLGLGALDLYRETRGSLDDLELAAAQTLADVTTAYLLNAQARVNLERASETETLPLCEPVTRGSMALSVTSGGQR